MGLLFTYTLTYGGAIVSLFRPFVGLLIYICFAVIRPESLWHWSVPQGNYSRIVAISLIVGWCLNGCGDWKLGRAKPIVLSLLAFWLWACLSLMQARNFGQAIVWLEGLTKAILPVVLGATLIQTVRQLKQLAWVLVLSHGYVAYDLNRSYYDGFNRLAEYGFGGMDNNSYCIAFCTAIGLAFFLGLNAASWWQSLLAYVSAGLMVNAVFFAFSRGGMLGLICTGAASFFLIPKGFRHYLAFAAALLVAYRLAGNEVVERFLTVFASQAERDTSAQSRLDMWSVCLRQMASHPILGLGPHHFPVYAREYGLASNKEAHNLWLQIGAELGVPGLMFLVLFYVLCVAGLWPYAKGRRPVSDLWYTDGARMVIAALTGFAVSSQFVSLPGLESPYYVALLGIGVLKLTSRDEPVETARFIPSPQVPRRATTPAMVTDS